MLVLGIDPGTLNLGFGLVCREGNRLRHVGHGVIRLPAGNSLSARLLSIADGLSELLTRHQPQVAAVESLFFHKDAQAASKLGHARGVVLLCLERAGVPMTEHAPARVKRTVVGHGQADKRQMALMVRTMLGLSAAPASDAADALALAITELRLGGQVRPLLEGNTDARRRLQAAIQRQKALRAAR